MNKMVFKSHLICQVKLKIISRQVSVQQIKTALMHLLFNIYKNSLVSYILLDRERNSNVTFRALYDINIVPT